MVTTLQIESSVAINGSIIVNVSDSISNANLTVFAVKLKIVEVQQRDTAIAVSAVSS